MHVAGTYSNKQAFSTHGQHFVLVLALQGRWDEEGVETGRWVAKKDIKI